MTWVDRQPMSKDDAEQVADICGEHMNHRGKLPSQRRLEIVMTTGSDQAERRKGKPRTFTARSSRPWRSRSRVERATQDGIRVLGEVIASIENGGPQMRLRMANTGISPKRILRLRGGPPTGPWLRVLLIPPAID